MDKKEKPENRKQKNRKTSSRYLQ